MKPDEWDTFMDDAGRRLSMSVVDEVTKLRAANVAQFDHEQCCAFTANLVVEVAARLFSSVAATAYATLPPENARASVVCSLEMIRGYLTDRLPRIQFDYAITEVEK